MVRDRLLWSGILFVAGVALLQQLSSLPSSYCYFFIPLCIGLCWWRPRLIVVCALPAGLLWAMLSAQSRLHTELPDGLIGKDIQVSGTVISIPESDDKRTRFEFQIERQPAATGQMLPLPMKVLISWYWRQDSGPPDISVGQRWQMQVRLKPPIGFMNPGGFDYEAWLFSHNIRATGYVREQGENHRLAQTNYRHGVSIFRSRLLDKLSSLSEDTQHQGILLALALGYRNAIANDDWDLLLKTGTNHLMAISGLHIGMVAGLIYFLVLWWIRMALARNWLRPDLWPAQRIAAIVAWSGALSYALLAGFALPTQRAVIMLTVGLLAVVAYRQLRPAQALVLALIAVLLFDPFAVNSAGFWLSFGAVAVLVYAYVGRKRKPRPRIIAAVLNWSKVQWVLLIGLFPMTVFWFGAAAVTASFANLIAIPLVGFLVVPLVLLAAMTAGFYAPLARLLLQLADQCLNLLWPVLELMQQLPLSRWEQPQPPLWTVLLALTGAALLLAPRGLPARWMGLFWCAPLLFYSPVRPQPGEVFLTALDVGQGTAIVAQTAGHSLIYDTGPKANERFDAGQLVVLPYLKSSGIRKADTLLVSHGDNDHIGGSAAILEAITVDRIISSVPQQLAPYQVEACRSGQNWVWDGVHFSILHPDRNANWQGNDSSCVLLIESGSSRVLLTGDIEKRAEQHLLREHPLQPVSILFAPHHGSRTSSTPAFIESLQPQHVIFNAGILNRFGFPKPDVLDRYLNNGSQTWITGEQGAIEFLVAPEGVRFKRSYRYAARRYWHYTQRIEPAIRSKKLL
jgi:competence protein ComEC